MSAVAHILDFGALSKLTGWHRPGDIVRNLRRQGIHVFEGKDGPWTTLELVNAAGGLKPSNDDEPEEAF